MKLTPDWSFFCFWAWRIKWERCCSVLCLCIEIKVSAWLYTYRFCPGNLGLRVPMLCVFQGKKKQAYELWRLKLGEGTLLQCLPLYFTCLGLWPLVTENSSEVTGNMITSSGPMGSGKQAFQAYNAHLLPCCMETSKKEQVCHPRLLSLFGLQCSLFSHLHYTELSCL